MRQLSKIVFVNSANIRYGEVRLDGNVHLIGTQGVGKSTVLRAILFFYTGDKTHLGISREKKSFDDFYLPGANSYIAYEVESEFGAFTVLVFRSHAHSVFRFIGAPFRREWLIDEQGEVTADASVIRSRLDGAPMTRIVDEYQEYRDIIYGNKRVTGKEFAWFCIMETPKYQNIPRSLQNVFLGAKVDADFIKDIIIRSLGDEEPGIDLVYFRSQLSGFEREYNDISQWFQKNKQGEVTVRRQGEKVVELYRKLLYLDDELTGNLLELRYARRYAQERIPLLDKQVEETEVLQLKCKEKLADLQDKYNHELSSLDQEIGALNEKLEKIPKLRKKYEGLGIQALIEEDGQESALKVSLESAESLRSRLTREYADITAKYKDREREMRLGFDAWRAARQGRKVEIGAALNAQIQKLSEALQAGLSGVEEAFAERVLAQEGLVADLKERIAAQDKQLALSAHLSPFVEEIKAAQAELSRLSGEKGKLEASVKTVEARIKGLEQEGQFQQYTETSNWDDKLSDVGSQMAGLDAKVAEIDELLASMDGSLIQWLSSHKPGWEETIGKVADERTVLYAKNLYPSETKGDSLFGVDLDLSSLRMNARTPQQLMKEKQLLEKERTALKERQEGILAEKESALVALRKKYNARIKPLRDELSGLQAAALMLPTKLEDAGKRLSLLEENTRKAREDAMGRCKEALQALTAEKVLAAEALSALLKEKEAEVQKLREADARGRRSLKKQHDEALSQVEAEISAREKELSEALEALHAEQNRELSGQGADATALEKCEGDIKGLQGRLEKITQNKETLFNYRKDKEEYLDKKDIFLSEKTKVEGKKTSLSERYKLKRRKEEDALTRATDSLRELQDLLRQLREGLSEADNFEQSNALPILPEGRENKTDKTCRQLIDAIHRVLSEKRNTEQTFYQGVNTFTSHFSPGNIFDFKTDNHTDEEYRSFASSLVDFMESDKIEEFRSRTSGHYTELLLRISHEMDEVSRNSSEIAGIIKDINYDFKEKNFIGAVKSIELRTIPSADKMVTLLQRIKEFADEHGYDLDQVNLFSGASRDESRSAAVDHLLSLMKLLTGEHSMWSRLTLSDTFQLQFRITENDNDTGWVEKISSVGSDGTDVLVKAMVNIMLINVFKERVSGRFSDFRIHCVMDEIGRLHPRNVRGILDFAGARNIYLVNGSPVPYNVADYKHTYLLSKDGTRTVIQSLLSRKEAAAE
ncbi:MAG: ATP-binding protein [Bacteroidales bacterium]|nr:ATP-binding protein [Bacteroidales bacterium]